MSYVESVHEGVHYPCDQCEHKATWAATLKTHVESAHDCYNRISSVCYCTYLHTFFELLCSEDTFIDKQVSSEQKIIFDIDHIRIIHIHLFFRSLTWKCFSVMSAQSSLLKLKEVFSTILKLMTTWCSSVMYVIANVCIIWNSKNTVKPCMKKKLRLTNILFYSCD